MHLVHLVCGNIFVVGASPDLQAGGLAVCWVRLTSLSLWPSVLGAIRATLLSFIPSAALALHGTFLKASSPPGHPPCLTNKL